MRRYISYNAAEIDEEYKRKKAYAKKKRANCKEKNCEQCQYMRICIIINDGIERNGEIW